MPILIKGSGGTGKELTGTISTTTTSGTYILSSPSGKNITNLALAFESEDSSGNAIVCEISSTSFDVYYNAPYAYTCTTVDVTNKTMLTHAAYNFNDNPAEITFDLSDMFCGKYVSGKSVSIKGKYTYLV